MSKALERGVAEMFDEDESDTCPYDFLASDEEFEAGRWLLATCKKIKGPNAKKARLFVEVLRRQGEHLRKLHDRIHELEAALAMREMGGDGSVN